MLSMPKQSSWPQRIYTNIQRQTINKQTKNPENRMSDKQMITVTEKDNRARETVNGVSTILFCKRVKQGDI